MQNDPATIARASYQAYTDKDREAIEALLAPDFHFTSPLDNRLDRDAYFEICWPGGQYIEAFDFIDVAAAGERVYVTYEATMISGQRFRNTEVVTVRAGQIVEVEVYFGWSVPHDVPEGEHRDPGAEYPDSDDDEED